MDTVVVEVRWLHRAGATSIARPDMTSRTFPLSRQRRRRMPQNGTSEGPETQSAGARPPAVRLPHEHDEHADAPQEPREVIARAEADIVEGKVDTDLRGQARAVFDKATSTRR